MWRIYCGSVNTQLWTYRHNPSKGTPPSSTSPPWEHAALDLRCNFLFGVFPLWSLSTVTNVSTLRNEKLISKLKWTVHDTQLSEHNNFSHDHPKYTSNMKFHWQHAMSYLIHYYGYHNYKIFGSIQPQFVPIMKSRHTLQYIVLSQCNTIITLPTAINSFNTRTILAMITEGIVETIVRNAIQNCVL